MGDRCLFCGNVHSTSGACYASIAQKAFQQMSQQQLPQAIQQSQALYPLSGIGIGTITWATTNNTFGGGGGGSIFGLAPIKGGGGSSTLEFIESPKPLKHDGVEVGEFIGWRIWQVKDNFLCSYSFPISWFPGEPMTGKPDDYNSAGIWALKTPHAALHKCLSEGGNFAVGSIWMWGDIIEHTEGYRSEYAEVRSIDYVPRDDKKLLASLRERYNVGSHKDLEENNGEGVRGSRFRPDRSADNSDVFEGQDLRKGIVGKVRRTLRMG